MCGIAGIVDIYGAPIKPEYVINMIRAISHRGPDDEGVYVETCGVSGDRSGSQPTRHLYINDMGGPYSVGLGHKRLSIIDLSEAGRQPLSNEDGSIWLVCNGEIYNYKELLRGIVERGHKLRSKTDSEVIIHLYEDYGDACVDHLRGMFAFGIWDRKKDRLLIARDRLGKKPLYYYYKAGRFIFASEIKAILTDPNIGVEIDLSALSLYLSLLYIPAPKTIFKGIYKVMPGALIRLEDGQLMERQYWDLRIEEGSEGIRGLHLDPDNPGASDKGWRDAEDYYANRVYELLRESVELRMISDVPLGAFLSGGIDSSAIVGIMSELSTRPIKTFSIGFGEDERYYDELRHARVVADRFHTDHREFVVKSDIVGLLPSVVRHFDEPFANPTAILMYLLSRETKRYVSVALSGTGGDEAFSGYTRYAGMRLSEYAQTIPVSLRRFLSYVVNKLPESANGRHIGRRLRHLVDGTLLSPDARYMRWVSVFHDELKSELFPNKNLMVESSDACAAQGVDTGNLHAGKSALYGDEVAYLGQYLTIPGISSIHNRIFYTDIKTYLPNNQLEYVDKMSMAHALEVRVPFCDHKLMEFSATIPYHLKLKGLNTKYLLKKAVSRILPAEIINRKKVGFNVPLGIWFKGSLSDFVMDGLSEDNIKRHGFFNPNTVKRIIEEHKAGKRDLSLHVWALLVFQVWYDVYIKYL